jgi:hypothetical protein
MSTMRRSVPLAQKNVPPVELNSPSCQPASIQSSIAATKARFRSAPLAVAVMIDTLSKFSPGMKENDNGEVSAFLASLSEQLRDLLHSTVLVVAHSGHAEAGRPRGAYALMANPDAEYIVERPNPAAMTVTVTRDRFKDTASLPPLAYTARVIDLGRRDAEGEPVTSLALDPADARDFPPKPKSGLGKNQERGLSAMREWTRANPGVNHMASTDLQALLKTQGVKDRNRRSEVIDFLVNLRVLTPAVGGHTVHPEALA